MGKTFTFGLNVRVKIVESGEVGLVVARAEYVKSEDTYYLRYKAANGRAVEQWWGESSLVAVAE